LNEVLLLTSLIFIAAALYAAVGHAGASGYLAAMALVGMAPMVMKPTALVLNILVAIIACFKYYRVGAFAWKLFIPLAVASIPFAYLGGILNLPTNIYKPVVGVILIYAAGYSLWTANISSTITTTTNPSLVILLVAGAILGFLSGLTGVGGGIFLSPLLLMFRWAPVKVISGVAAAFILVNSIAGLLGVATTTTSLPDGILYWAVAAVIGGYIGAEFGSKRLGNPNIQRLLSLVLFVAGLKMIATA
jgi:hypothetical protein